MSDKNSENILIKNKRLAVTISNPGTFYKGSRFDWNGFVTRVLLDGKHTYCVPESLIPGKGTGGCGLCGEFGIDGALGYEDIPAELFFTKIGVGLLQKPDNRPYEFHRQYYVIPVSSHIEKDEDYVNFSVNAPVHNGYGYEYKKSISLKDNHLIISYFLKNTGNSTISTTEYCHNFIGIDNETVDSSYSLKLPCDLPFERTVGEFFWKNGEITWPDGEMKREFYGLVSGFRNNGCCSWEIFNSKAGAGVRGTNDFQACRFAVWGYKHVISPEVFIQLDLEPGQSKAWSRDYEFYYEVNK